MGQAAMTNDELENLEKIQILEIESPIFSATGNYQGMSGPKKDNYMMFGSITLLENDSLFIKMIGPESDMQNQKEKFTSFCKSLH